MDLYDDPVLERPLGYSDFMFGGVDIAQYFRGYTIERSIMPSVEVEELTISGRDGAIPNGYRTAPLTITVSGALNAHDRATVEAIRQRLGRLLLPSYQGPSISPHVVPGDGRRTLYLGEKLGDYHGQSQYIVYDAIVKGSTELDRNYAYPHVSIGFYVLDGYGYNNVTKHDTLSSSLHIVPQGNVLTYPTIEITSRSSGTELVITNDAIGRESIKTYDERLITINCDDESVTTPSGYPAMFDLSSDFFALIPQMDNSMSISGGTATIYWKERFV